MFDIRLMLRQPHRGKTPCKLAHLNRVATQLCVYSINIRSNADFFGSVETAMVNCRCQNMPDCLRIITKEIGSYIAKSFDLSNQMPDLGWIISCFSQKIVEIAI